jgi:hypothetical protein
MHLREPVVSRAAVWRELCLKSRLAKARNGNSLAINANGKEPKIIVKIMFTLIKYYYISEIASILLFR